LPDDLLLKNIEGALQDQDKRRYQSLNELAQYCDLVASSVGRLCIRIIQSPSIKDADEYAKKLGIAFQLTNIIRDIKEDALRDRIYIPQEFLKSYKLSDEDIFKSYESNQMNLMIRELIKIARQHYTDSEKLFSLIPKNSASMLLMMRDTYYQLLCEIEKAPIDVFKKRISVPKFKILYLFSQHKLIQLFKV